MYLGYVWEKLHLAVTGLAGSEQSLQERLAGVYCAHVVHLQRKELPEDVQKKFDELTEALDREEAKGNEGTVMASALVLDELEARKLIESIVSMYDTVCRMYGQTKEGS